MSHSVTNSGLASGNLEIRDVAKSFGAVNAVAGVDLSITAGDFVVFLGPSGCGKTTLLRIIAGFERADRGTLALDGRSIGAAPPNLRDVGMVFQNLALFPHLTVEQNIAFGLDLRRTPKQEIDRSVGEMLDLVELNGLGQRYISQLSGGQKQRVALARALVLKPAVLLLDEPLSALDMKLRRQLQRELKEIQRQTRTTFIFVTHDQEEALSMADRVAVFNRGKVEQFGLPQDLYQRPKNRFVAEFVGDANICSARRLSPFGINIPDDELLIVRPERCLVGNAAESMPAKIEGTIQAIDFIGSHVRLQVACNGTDDPWIALCSGEEVNRFTIGAKVYIGFNPDDSTRLKVDPR